jgi:peptide deformylase
MEANRGMGLAAPQIGMPLRFFVMRTTDGRSIACFNPQIISVSSDTEKGDEGCLSFPDLWLKVRRPIKAEVRYFDQNGNLVNETFENLNARAFQHELDHLNGVVFTTKVSNLSLSMAKKRMHR